MAILTLTGSVGSGISKGGLPHNQSEDVKKVRDRLISLGYAWLSGMTTGKETEFIRTIKLFQSICKGSGQADQGDGRIDQHGNTHRWLAATNAPGWLDMTGKFGAGWRATPDLEFKVKNSHTTTWMEERIRWAGFVYNSRAFFGVSDAPPMWVRDCSPPTGGNASGHKSHETGIDVDIRLPLLPPYTHLWTRLEGHNYTKMFHREAAFIQVEAINSQMDPMYVWFNDPEFIARKLCTKKENHSNHYHVRINPPARVDGIYM